MKLTRAAVAAAMVVVGVAGLLPARAAEVTKSKNVTHLDDIQYKGGTELAASGKYVYTGELNGTDNRGQNNKKGGMHVIDVSGPRPKEVGFLHCPGDDNDVEVVKPGLVVMGFHGNLCAPTAGNGFMTIDVTNPREPRILGSINTGKNHTLKPVPGTNLVYTAGGGLAPGGGAGPAVVDVSNPRKPKVVAKPKTITSDCHDISFSFTKERKLGFCTGAIGTGEVHIWDMSDPLEPTMAGKIVNPAVQYSHYAVASSDGKYLAVDDEAFALHECVSGQSPTGRVWVYDITNIQTPVVVGAVAAPRGDPGVGTFPGWVPSWCLSHGLDWKPGSHHLGVTWFNGGWSVLTIGQGVGLEETAYWKADDSATYSVLWHDGKLFTNDMYRGFDAFKVKV